MGLEQIARFVLVLEAAACLWLAFLAWREGEGAPPLARMLAAAIGCGAAAIIVYGLMLA
jgi:hypothetical protein